MYDGVLEVTREDFVTVGVQIVIQDSTFLPSICHSKQWLRVLVHIILCDQIHTRKASVYEHEVQIALIRHVRRKSAS